MSDHVLITGGAGFIGTHLSAALLERGAHVTAVDNLSAGRLPTLPALLQYERFRLVEHDITVPLDWSEPVTAVMHLASPIGPAHVREHPVSTLMAGSAGTVNALEIARRHQARIVLVSSAEVYGDPNVQPQPESYRGSVDPVGPMSGYQEAKRFLEAMAAAYRREHGVKTGIVRPFNVYGPGMLNTDTRVVAAFVTRALAGQELIVNGPDAVRSLCYIDDFVAGLLAMMDCNIPGPVNLGAAEGTAIGDLAALVVSTVGSGTVTTGPSKAADGTARCPDITLARQLLDWEPTTLLRDGIAATVEAMRAAAAPPATVRFDVPSAWLSLIPESTPRPLRCRAGCVRDALRWLTSTYPVLAARLLSPSGELVPWTNLFLDQDNVRDLEGMDTVLSGDVVLVALPAMAGG
ncbi:NAD-dependent epimerase/dehydratase family protein [Actinacidiphila rubida]|uniref:dTDP-glucose 4,6-dehydratase n=1 Tax=Actinacidiphila rubida TaxID=310780 RepID=A0A1H8TFW3_9ACTN|nr:NAD-dependent epimerase/dehydratase family protein [Actinacidiphila rubida]SEO89514.1 dTDP-glucose 4,6-dehydratase [Actinacidiphila rubida]